MTAVTATFHLMTAPATPPPGPMCFAVRVTAVLFLFLGLGSLVAGRAEAQDTPRRTLDQDYYRRPYPQLVKGAARALLSRTQVVESEPNNDFLNADLIVLGDTIGGFIDPAGDVDYFAVDLTAGVRADFDIDAFSLGSSLDPILTLYSTDGVTRIDFSDDVVGLDSRLVYEPMVSGRYFLSVTDVPASGGPGFFYTLKAAVIPTGPGDPTTFHALGLGGPLGFAAGDGTEFYVVDNPGIRILKVDMVGGNTEVASLETSGLGSISDIVRDVVMDGFGDLLAVGRQNIFEPVVWRITPDGAVSEFFVSPNPQSVFATITVDRRGDVWVVDEIDPGSSFLPAVLHFDALGNFIDIFDISAAGSDFFDAAFSPSGELHFTNVFGDVYKLDQAGAVVPAILRQGFSEGIAFDIDGYLYLADGSVGRVHLFDPAYVQVDNPFAGTNMAGPLNLAFSIDPNGTVGSRLFVTNFGVGLPPPFAGAMMEMRGGSIRAPGYKVSDFLTISRTLPSANIGIEYDHTLTYAGQTGPATWKVLTGALPQGVALDEITGLLDGIPLGPGSFDLTVSVDDGTRMGFANLTLTVVVPQIATSDVANAIFGLRTLTSQEVSFLDRQGNLNGGLDIGDLRAHLRTEGQLPGAGSAVASAGGSQ
jgi:hypothetical protein